MSSSKVLRPGGSPTRSVSSARSQPRRLPSSPSLMSILAEIGSVIGQYPASALISPDPAKSRYRPIVSAIGRRVADFAGPAYGIEVISLDIRRLSLPEQNRAHVFDRMKAERAKIAKENRSAGELEARKITAEADHEKGPHRGRSRRRSRAHQGGRRRGGLPHLRGGVRAGSEVLRIPPHPASLRQDP